MEKRIELVDDTCGIICDAPQCGWKDDSVTFATLEQWRNCPCPKCGANVLTDEDWELHLKTTEIMEAINNMTDEELQVFEELVKNGDIEVPDFIKDFANGEEEGEYRIEITTHKEIKIDSIKKIE